MGTLDFLGLPTIPYLTVPITGIHYTSSLRKMSANDAGFIAALEEAKKSFAEGGVPIGACLVAADGKILGRGHNMRVQKSSAILHVR